MLVLATLIAANCPDAPFVETGFAKQLTVFATFQEGNIMYHKGNFHVILKRRSELHVLFFPITFSTHCTYYKRPPLGLTQSGLKDHF